MAKQSLINSQWYLVCQPWGNDTTIKAFARDAAGQWIADCDWLTFYEDTLGEEYLETPQDIAAHIVNLHNQWLEQNKEDER